MDDQVRPPPEPEEHPAPERKREPDPRRGALLGRIIAIVLVRLGLLLVKVLGDAGRLQDCVMSGRTNCAPIDSSSTQ